MQLSERFRRGVVVPLDDAAMKAMEEQDVAESTRVHFIEIADQAEFELLWGTGVFGAINEATDSMVDDYEEAEIPPEMVSRVRKIAESYASAGKAGAVGARFFAALKEACDVAERGRKPMYFVL